MQYHLNGFRSGDPNCANLSETMTARADTVDVAIIGCGPAGLTLAAQLATIGGISVRIFDRKSRPLEVGQADGVACRSMEMFEAFGFVEKVLKEAYWVNETTFWRTGTDGAGLARADRIQDVEDALSHQPHVILSQARIHDFYLDIMRNGSGTIDPDYSRNLAEVKFCDDSKSLIFLNFECLDSPGKHETVCARYVVGCDGARSTVRTILGHELKGHAARQLWGVMDVLAVTDFPDIRLKCAVQSARSGSLLIIPREGGYLVRLYIELDELRGAERASDREVTSELLERKAREILFPYTFDVREVAWWSAYEIGQRVCDAFDDVPAGERSSRIPRIFIAGDACHTHSPKAGQGMNVSMADTFNLGWKLAAVIRGQARPELLHTYSEERRAKAKELIDFDRDMARLFSEKPSSTKETAQFQRYFQKHGRYTAGVETTYDRSLIVGAPEHQGMATGLRMGTRFHSAPVIRLADAKPMQLSEALAADGRFRIVAFADRNDDGGPDGRIAALCRFLGSDPCSPVLRHTPQDADPDAVIDFRVVFQKSHRQLDLNAMPGILLPAKGKLGLTDYEKIFCADPRAGTDIFDMRGVDRETGVLIVVRPDQFVAQLLPIDEYMALSDFFGGILIIQHRFQPVTAISAHGVDREH